MEELVNPKLHEITSAGAAYGYWILFIIPAFFALFGDKRSLNDDGFFSLRFDGLWWLFFIMISILLGFRVQVGGDWGAYLKYYEIINSSPLSETFSLLDDPSFILINWLSSKYGFGIYGVNFLSALIFTYGLFIFCRSLPRPFLALTAAIPYMVIVVGMGYTRQGIALGLIMLGFVAITRQKNILFLMLIILAATFHKTAIIMLGIAGLINAKNKFLTISIVVVIFYIAFTSLLSESYGRLIQYYYQETYQSSGALVRILMLTLPSVLFLIFMDKFKFNRVMESLWWWIAVISIGLLILLFVVDASTAIDRIGLYFLPIQLLVFSYLPDIFSRRGDLNRIIILLIISYYVLVLYIWLYHATYSYMWRPYRNALFEML